VDHVGTGLQHVIDLLAQPREIGGQNRRGNQIFRLRHEAIISEFKGFIK